LTKEYIPARPTRDVATNTPQLTGPFALITLSTLPTEAPSKTPPMAILNPLARKRPIESRVEAIRTCVAETHSE
jgi:hypothetical protein